MNEASECRREAMEKAVELLTEHFDCVQLFASVYEDGATYQTVAGSGNMFARVCQVERWLNMVEQEGSL